MSPRPYGGLRGPHSPSKHRSPHSPHKSPRTSARPCAPAAIRPIRIGAPV